MQRTRLIPLILAAVTLLASCKDTGKSVVKEEEDETAKKMLQGTWIGEDDCVAFSVKKKKKKAIERFWVPDG